MFVLTHSNMAAFRDCPFKFKTRYIDKLTPIVVKETLKIGTAFHLYREKGWEATEDYLNSFYPSTQEEVDAIEVQKAIVKGMTYLAPDEPDVIREVEWLNPLINPKTNRKSRYFKLGGKADGLFGVKGQQYVLIEEKTRGKSLAWADIDKLSIDNQILNAIVNLEYDGYNIHKVWYRFYRKPSIRQRQGETLESYTERVVEDYLERPSFYFHEEGLFYPKEQLDAFKSDLWQVGQAIIWFKNHGIWYRNTSHCADWGGCEYLPLCRGDDVDLCRGDDVEGLYRIGKVNPELTKEEANELT